jgi:nucleoside-diphosphate-sugar epimerase
MISIFGSSGFIGSKFSEKFKSSAILIERNASSAKSDDVLYFISTVHNYNIFDDPYIDINTNLTKLIEVLEDYRKSGRSGIFNFISSWFVYGKTNELPAKETSTCNPTGFYSITKYTAEKLLISYCETFDIKYRILRLTNILGKSDNKISKKKNALQFMLNSLKNNEDINLYDDGNAIRDYMSVEDCCRAINLIIEKSNVDEIYNISNQNPVKIKDIIFYAKNKINSNSKINFIETPKFHKIVQVENMFLDNSKLLSYGYTPKKTIYEVIDQLLEA